MIKDSIKKERYQELLLKEKALDIVCRSDDFNCPESKGMDCRYTKQNGSDDCYKCRLDWAMQKARKSNV